MNKPNDMYMMIGPPCAGKDTYIQKTFPENINIISLDDIIDHVAFALGSTYSVVFPLVSKLAEKKLNQRIDYVFKDYGDVIWNQTNMVRKSRIGKLSRVPENFNKIAVIIEWPSIEVLFDRNIERHSTTGKYIPPSVIESMIASYQEPTHDEGFDEIWKVAPRNTPVGGYNISVINVIEKRIGVN